ncbi:unnamed protein product [Sphenostylis stenocarpa]|uniref:Uncharacterized protein n=1 Tax=Sphenostylis stenocarpa TaxID=92480 RepID=A0AA86SNB7_9FABA|nr:unnamed protein product [Sphenostylis stenocarpa]
MVHGGRHGALAVRVSMVRCGLNWVRSSGEGRRSAMKMVAPRRSRVVWLFFGYVSDVFRMNIRASSPDCVNSTVGFASKVEECVQDILI